MFSKDIDLDENIILKNKIPILIEDENWIKLFSDVDDKYIINHKEELEELLKEQKKLKMKFLVCKKKN